MATKVIVFGAEGMLGTSIVSHSDTTGDLAATGLDREACDITDLERIKEICSILRPQVLINCAAFTDVDGAEKNEDAARLVNAIGAANVAKVATSHDALMLQISTDYVFDGSADTPYTERAKPAPLSAYARTKLEGEEAVRRECKNSLILRTGWLYGAGSRTFVSKILERAARGEELRVVDDQIGCPTYVGDLAEVILQLVRKKKTGIVHAVNQGQTSWYGLARTILEFEDLQANLSAISSAELTGAAPRPPYSVLDTSKLEGWIDDGMAPWEDALSRFLSLEVDSEVAG